MTIQRSKMIFKDLEYCLRDTKIEYKDFDKEDIEGFKLVKNRLLALKRVADYVDSCDWLIKEEAKEKIRFIRAAHYNYKMVREELSMSEDAVKSFVKYCIARLKEKIGANTIDLIMEDKVQVALVQFETLRGTYSLDALFNSEVLKNLPQSEFKPDILLHCKKEIQFLYDYSKEEMRRRYEDLDGDRLAFIRYIIEKDTPKFAEDKFNLVRLFSGNGSLEDYYNKIEEETNYRP